ncbi:MAG: DUF3040 domain-containing protein [Acidimicrobiales bacterium]
MNDDQISHAIQRIEQGLADDDPSFVQRFRAVRRAEACTVLAVFLLLATGAVLVTVGLAVPSWIAWGAGLLAFAASVAVDEHHKRA